MNSTPKRKAWEARAGNPARGRFIDGQSLARSLFRPFLRPIGRHRLGRLGRLGELGGLVGSQQCCKFRFRVAQHLGFLMPACPRNPPGTGRDQPTHDHVLLETAQVVDGTADGGIGEYPGGFLERGGRDERLGRQRGLGDAQKDTLEYRRTQSVAVELPVFLDHVYRVELLALQELAVARVENFDLAQHLPDDDLDVLVVDLHALEPIDVLDFLHQVIGQRLDAQQAKNVVRIELAVDDGFALLHVLAFEHLDLTPLRNQIFVRIALLVGNHQALLALGLLAVADGTRGFGKHRRFLRTPGFEKVGHARQTTGDVAGLGRFLRNARQNVADFHFLTVTAVDHGAGRQEVLGRLRGARKHQRLALFVDQANRRPQVLAFGSTLLRIDDDRACQTGDFVGLLGNGHALDKVLERGLARHLGDDRVRMRIPVGHDLTGRHAVAFANAQHCTVRNLVALALAAVAVDQRKLAGPRNRDQLALGVFDRFQVEQANRTGGLDLDLVDRNRARRGTTDMEGTHGQLSAGLPDGLSRDAANRFAGIHRRTACKIATVTLGADAVAGFTGDRRTHQHTVDCVLLERGTLLDEHWV